MVAVMKAVLLLRFVAFGSIGMHLVAMAAFGGIVHWVACCIGLYVALGCMLHWAVVRWLNIIVLHWLALRYFVLELVSVTSTEPY